MPPRPEREAGIEVVRLWLSVVCGLTVGEGGEGADLTIRDTDDRVPVWVEAHFTVTGRRRRPRVHLGLRHSDQGCGLALAAELAVADPSGQWRWMKSYRVWEANRQVFVHPDDWMEPALCPQCSRPPEIPAPDSRLLYICEIPASLCEDIAGMLLQVRKERRAPGN